MIIWLINKSTVLPDETVRSWVPSFNRFIADVRKWWPRPVELRYVDKSEEPKLAWKVIIADTSDEAGALGYHDFTPDGRPISYVFVKDDIKYGYSPTITATHEIAEMIADPWISQNFQVTNDSFFAQEICDPCEADEYGYDIDGVQVSDFVTPRYFVPESDPAKYLFDFKQHINEPCSLLPGGYMSVFTSGKGWDQIYAQKGPEAEQGIINYNKPHGRSTLYGRSRPRPPVGVLNEGEVVV